MSWSRRSHRKSHVITSNYPVDLFISALCERRSLWLRRLPSKSSKHVSDSLQKLATMLLNKCDTYLFTYLRSWALLEEPPIVQPLKNLPTLYGTRMFNTVFTRALHWFLFWAISIQSTPSHPMSLRSILILSTRLRLGLRSGLFPSGFPNNILYAFLCYTPRPSHSSSLDYSNYAWRRVQVMELLIIQLSPSCHIKNRYISKRNIGLPRPHALCRVASAPVFIVPYTIDGTSNNRVHLQFRVV
jgi:hypothetical protein